ncbi:MAG: Peptidase M19 [Oscillospiraceae bacterium]
MKYFDLHCDTITKCYENHLSLKANELNVSLEKGLKYENWAQIFAIWLKDEQRGEEAFRYFSDVAKFFEEEMAKNAETVTFCRTSDEIKQAAKESKEIALLSIEGAAALAGKMEHLYDAWSAGVRLITLTWNGRCETGDGCKVQDARGLTPFGLDLVREMNRINVIVDVSHLSEPGFWDVARHAQKPFIATHSDSRAVCDCERNLSDDQFREIVQVGGLVGINFFEKFLSQEHATIEDIFRHIDHFLNLGGEKVVAMGSDFDGCKLVDGLRGLEDVDSLYDAICGEFGEEIADSIFYENAYRFFTENLN